MKTTLEIPDAILRRTKSKAAQQGISLRQFVTEAVAARLQATPANDTKPWMKYLAN
jgi:predicted HicB family RNase H-like nuclease